MRQWVNWLCNQERRSGLAENVVSLCFVVVTIAQWRGKSAPVHLLRDGGVPLLPFGSASHFPQSHEAAYVRKPTASISRASGAAGVKDFVDFSSAFFFLNFDDDNDDDD